MSVDLPTYLAGFGLKATWVTKGRSAVFKNAFTTIEVEADRREVTINGLRVFFGDPVAAYKGTLYLSKTDADLMLGAILRPAALAVQAPAVRVIAIDPGHGGSDPGMVCPPLKINEKTMALDVARRLRSLLETKGYKVVLTRNDDRQLAADKSDDLVKRADIANRAGADLFVSIHFNSVDNAPLVRGTETYLLTRAGQRSTGTIDRDRADEKRLPGNRMDGWNALLGYAVHRRLVDKLDSMDRGLKFARFKVLTMLECPGILIESAYLSNLTEAKKVATPAFRQDIAEALAAGIDAYATQVDTARKR